MGGSVWSSVNVADGYAALNNNQPNSTTNGVSDTEIGEYVMNLIIGYDNIAVGLSALYTIITGYENGASAGRHFFNYIGNDNSATGYKALKSNNDGSSNTANGNNALYSPLV